MTDTSVVRVILMLCLDYSFKMCNANLDYFFFVLTLTVGISLSGLIPPLCCICHRTWISKAIDRVFFLSTIAHRPCLKILVMQLFPHHRAKSINQ